MLLSDNVMNLTHFNNTTTTRKKNAILLLTIVFKGKNKEKKLSVTEQTSTHRKT